MPLTPMYPANNPVTVQLSQQVTAATGVLPVTDISVFPPPPNFATVGTGRNAEMVLYQGIDTQEGTLTGCQRGRFETRPNPWNAGEFICHAWGSDNTNTLMENILVLEEEKAAAETVQALEQEVQALAGGLETLNQGKANTAELAALAQSLTLLEERLADCATDADIVRIDAAVGEIQAILNALEGGAGSVEVARLEAAIAALNAALGEKAAVSQVTALTGEVADQTQRISQTEQQLGALEASLGDKAGAEDISRLEAALEDKAGAEDISRLEAALGEVSAAAGASRVTVHPLDLGSSGWEEYGDYWRQGLSLTAADGDVADFSADMATLCRLMEEGILLHLENNGGSLYAVAGALPAFDIQGQAALHRGGAL